MRKFSKLNESHYINSEEVRDMVDEIVDRGWEVASSDGYLCGKNVHKYYNPNIDHQPIKIIMFKKDYKPKIYDSFGIHHKLILDEYDFDFERELSNLMSRLKDYSPLIYRNMDSFVIFLHLGPMENEIKERYKSTYKVLLSLMNEWCDIIDSGKTQDLFFKGEVVVSMSITKNTNDIYAMVDPKSSRLFINSLMSGMDNKSAWVGSFTQICPSLQEVANKIKKLGFNIGFDVDNDQYGKSTSGIRFKLRLIYIN